MISAIGIFSFMKFREKNVMVESLPLDIKNYVNSKTKDQYENSARVIRDKSNLNEINEALKISSKFPDIYSKILYVKGDIDQIGYLEDIIHCQSKADILKESPNGYAIAQSEVVDVERLKNSIIKISSPDGDHWMYVINSFLNNPEKFRKDYGVKSKK